ncbi:MAG: PadR family transcriptional regulator [Gemmatimonadota bacterium]
MTTRTFQVLLALVEGPVHGYGIRQRVAERTDGEVKLGSGTLYEVIHRLSADGMISEVDPPEAVSGSGGPRRRFYTLTETGRGALRAEVRRMERDVQYARGVELLSNG